MSQQSSTSTSSSFTTLNAPITPNQQRLISPTLNLGVHYQSQVINGVIYALDQIPGGDFLWGREGRYTVSFFLLEAGIVNNMVGKDFKSALIKLKEIVSGQKERNIGQKEKDSMISRLEDELVLDLDEYINLSYPSDYIQGAIVEEVALRYMDILTHRPFAFFEGPRADDKTIKQQLDALSMLSSIEKRLSSNNNK